MTANTTPGVQNTVIQKIKPFKPKQYEGSQYLEVVTRYLDEVEHYVRQGASMRPKASSDNQNIDTFWRFLSVKIFRWFEKEMKEREVDTIPPTDSDYMLHLKYYGVGIRIRTRQEGIGNSSHGLRTAYRDRATDSVGAQLGSTDSVAPGGPWAKYRHRPGKRKCCRGGRQLWWSS